MAQFTSLPIELVEYILVLSLFSQKSTTRESTPKKGTSSRDPVSKYITPSPLSLSRLSQTCKHFHNLIYHPGSAHLWHSLFLACFDDTSSVAVWHRSLSGIPHLALPNDHAGEITARGREVGLADEAKEESGLDWQAEFTRRMAARQTVDQMRNYVPHHLHLDPRIIGSVPKPWCNRPLRRTTVGILQTLKDALRTLPPVPLVPPSSDDDSTDMAVSDSGEHHQLAPRTKAPWAPLATFYTSMDSDSHSPLSLPTIQSEVDIARISAPSSLPLSTDGGSEGVERSKTVAWLENLLLGPERSYPRYLLEEYFAAQQQFRAEMERVRQEVALEWGKVSEVDEDIDNEDLKRLETKLFSEILLLRGSGPIPISEKRSATSSMEDLLGGTYMPTSPDGPEWDPSPEDVPPSSPPAGASAAGPSTEQPTGDDDDDDDLTPASQEVFPLEDRHTSYLKMARRQARRKVYYIRYLMKERMWGPWEVIPRFEEKVEERERKRDEREKVLQDRENRWRFGQEDGSSPPTAVDTAPDGSLEVGDDDGEEGGDEDEDEDDEDWTPDMIAYGPGELYEELVLNDDEEDFGYEEVDDDDDEEDVVPRADNVFVISEDEDEESNPGAQGYTNLNGADGPSSSRPLPPQAITEEDGFRLIPDYEYLAAARIVIEANLREHQTSAFNGATGLPGAAPGTATDETLPWPNTGGIGLEMGRAGSAAGFAGAKPRAADEATEANGVVGVAEGLENGEARDVKGKGKAVDRDSEWDGVGWDWAGVEGEWRRCVCFLDYRDLLMFNLQQNTRRSFMNIFEIEPMEEAIRIIPMTLKVKSYSAPPKRPFTSSTSISSSSASSPSGIAAKVQESLSDLVYTLPVIHFEGTSRGSDVNPSETRHVSGTVRMLECGAVRWSLFTHSSDDDAPEWASENVQIGGIGSALGFIGLWTGALHERNDPLGPIWSWKIA